MHFFNKTIIVLTFSLLISTPGFAKKTTLSLKNFLKELDQNYPKLINKNLDISISKQNQREAFGAFDLNLNLETYKKIGFYDNQALRFEVAQYLPIWGVEILAGWRIGDGNFPDYDQFIETQSEGEAFGSLKIPLLKNRSIDKKRFNLLKSNIEFQYAKNLFQMHRLRLHSEASKVYWNWMARHKIVNVYQDLLNLALQRQQGLETQVQNGGLAKIHLLDNKLAVQSRKALLLDAKRKLAETSQKLFVFFDANQDNQNILNESFKPQRYFPESGGIDWSQGEWLTNHPEVQNLLLRQKILKREQKLRKNATLPKLDLKLSVEKDFGTSNSTLQDEEFKGGLSFSFPLQNRKALSKEKTASIKLRKIENDISLLKTQFNTNSETILSNLNKLKSQIRLYQSAVDLSQQLRKAEKTKFQSGASDLLIVNLREERLAKAQVDLILIYELYFDMLSDSIYLHGLSPLNTL